MLATKFVGIDVSKDSFTIAILSPQDGSFSLNSEGMEKFFQLLNPSCHIAIESSGPYSSLLVGNLSQQGFKPRLVNPLRIKNFSSSLSLRLTKTDPIDARTIALFLASNPNSPDPSTPDIRRQGLTLLSRQLESLSQTIASIKNQIHQLLHFLFPELPAKVNPFSQTMLYFLLAFPSAQAIRQAPAEAIAQTVKKSSPFRC